jgi:hypothetical protein
MKLLLNTVSVMLISLVITTKPVYASTDQLGGYKAALDFSTSFFIEKNINKTLDMVSPKASFRAGKLGSAIKELKKLEGIEKTIIKELIFFDKKSFSASMLKLSKTYHIQKQEWIDRYPAYLDKYLSESSVGCLAVVNIGSNDKDGIIILALIFDKEDGQYKLIQFSDPI